MFRKTIEKLARGKHFKRRLPKEFGGAILYVTPDAALRYLQIGDSAFDLELLQIAKEFVHEGNVIWDIGANVGSFSFAAATIAGAGGSVLSVEADIWLAGLIRKSANLRQNRHLRIDVLPAAVSDRIGIAAFTIAARGRASNSLEATGARSQAGGVRERHFAPTVTLDSLLEVSRPPDMVKIDVEGAEAAVLSGASRLLREVRPILYCEVGHDQNSSVTDILQQANYILVDPARPADQRQPLSKCPFNALAYPEEAAGMLKTVTRTYSTGSRAP